MFQPTEIGEKDKILEQACFVIEFYTYPGPSSVWGDSAGGQLAALLGIIGDVPTLDGKCGSLEYSSRVPVMAARSAPYDFLSTDGLMIN